MLPGCADQKNSVKLAENSASLSRTGNGQFFFKIIGHIIITKTRAAGRQEKRMAPGGFKEALLPGSIAGICQHAAPQGVLFVLYHRT